MSNILLKVDGAVRNPLQLTFKDLSAVDERYQMVDVSRIDPKRPGDAILLEGLLTLAQVEAEAAYITLHASTDDFHASVPLREVRERGLLIYRMNGEPLSLKAGGPIRFYIRDFAACHTADVDECANVKFVDHIELGHERGRDNRPQTETDHAELHKNPGH